MASKYYNNFLLSPVGLHSPETESLRKNFEKSLHQKTRSITAAIIMSITPIYPASASMDSVWST